MWKCPICDTNNAEDQDFCPVCNTVKSDIPINESPRATFQGSAQGNNDTQQQKNAQPSDTAGGQANQEQVISPAGSPGVDLRYNVVISLEESVFGTEKQIEYIREVKCPVCGGSGAAIGSSMTICEVCKGTGEDHAAHRFLSKEPSKATALCKACHGTGKRPVAKCSNCHGLGRSSAHESKSIRIPAGINTDQSLLCKGLGNVSYNGGVNGDLYVSIRVTNHEKYTREGFDLYADLPVPASVVASCGEVIFSTLRDTVKFRIPQSTEDGSLLRLKNQGVPYLNSSDVGDLFLKVRIT